MTDVKAEPELNLALEVRALRQRVADLELALTECQQANKQGQLYEAVVHHTLEAIMITTPDLDLPGPKILYVNPAFTTLTGYSTNEVVGQSLPTLQTSLTAQALLQELGRTLPQGQPFYRELSGWRKDGSPCLFEWSITALRADDEHLTHFVVLTRDVTARKQAEEDREQRRRHYEFIANTSREFMTLINRGHVYEVVNEAYCRAHGKVMEEIIGRHVAEVWGEDRYQNIIKRHLDRCFAGHEIHYQGWFDFARLGNRHFDVTYYPFFDETGQVTHAVVVSHDFTIRKEAEDRLAESERRYRLISDIVTTYIYGYRVEADGRLVYEWVTDAFIRVTKYTLAELVEVGGNPGLSYAEDRPIVEQHLARILAGETDVSIFRIVTKDGQVRWLQDYAQPVWDKNQTRVAFIYGAVQDITEQKEAEIALQQNQLVLKQITDLIPEAIYVYDLETHRNIYLNQYIVDLLGYSLAEIEAIGDNFFEKLLHPDDYGCYDDFIQYLYDGADSSGNWAEYRMRHRDGSWRWLYSHEVVFNRTAEGRPRQTLGIVQDISERKLAQDALQKAHQTLRFHVENSPLGVIEWDRDFRVQNWSSRAEEIFGWSAAEAIGKHRSDLPFIFAAGMVTTDWVKVGPIDDASPRRVHEYPNFTKDGAAIFCVWHESALFDGQGRLISVLSLIQDITAQTLATAALQHRFEFKRLIATMSTNFINMAAETIDGGIDQALAMIGDLLKADHGYLLLFTADGQRANMTHEWCAEGIDPQWYDYQDVAAPGFPLSVTNLSCQNFLYIPDVSALPGQTQAEIKALSSVVTRSLVGVTLVDGEHLIGFLGFDTQKEKQVWSEEIISLIEIVGAIFVNTLKRKQVETALRLSEERYELATNVGKAGVWDWDLIKNEIYLSANLKAILGYEDHEIPNVLDDWLALIHPDDQQMVLTEIQNHLTNQTPQIEIEHRMFHKDGTVRWLLIRGHSFRTETGEPYRVLGADTDITDFKRVEEFLQYRIALEELILSVSTHFVNLPIHQVDDEIQRTLEIIGNFFRVDASYIALENETNHGWQVLYEWQTTSGTHLGHQFISPSGRAFHWYLQEMHRRGYLRIAKLADLPPEFLSEKVDYERLGVQSFIMVPLNHQGRRVGLIGLVSIRQPGEWSLDVIAMLKLVGEMFLNALERKHTEQRLQDSLKEKEILLREIHHRVKNNLQIVSSLLYLQAGDIHDERVSALFQDSQSRIRSMALIHEKLYETKDLVRVNFAGYIESLIVHLLRSYKVDPARIALEMEIAPISLNIDLAIPCGLIINELISNSLKHAFPQDAKGKIQIILKEEGPAWLSLLVRDNGCGLPPKFDFEETTSLGLLLVRRLTKQVNGMIELFQESGTEYRITFPARELSKGDGNRE